MVDLSVFRDVLAQWPSGVTVVTTLADASSAHPTWHGMTASSFSSVSLNPPLVSICLDRSLYSHGLVSASGVFGISVLAKDQAEVARRFAGLVPGCADRFSGETWSTAETGVPLLDSALGWLDCRIVHEHDGGDHTIFVGEVLAGHTARKSAPLLFHSRGWGQFADVLPDVATLSDTGLADLPGGFEHIATGLSAAGVRVRVARPLATPAGPTSMLVTDRLQAHQAFEAGVDVAELVVHPGDAVAVDRAHAVVAGTAERCSIHLLDAFDPARADQVLAAVAEFSEASVLEICLTDSAGAATPLEVRGMLQEAVALARPAPIRMGLHDRDRLGLVKAITALKSGVSHFDTTLTGRGGTVATEDLVRLLQEVDVATPVDVSALAELAQRLRREPGHGLTNAYPEKLGAAG